MEKTKVFVLLCGLVAALALWQCDAAALDNEDEEDSLLVRGLGSLGSLGTSLLGGSGPLGMIGSVLSGGGTATPAQKCNTNCPAPTGPDCAVCACCGGTDRTFDTQCCLESWNCQNPSSQCTFKSNGKCPPPCDNNCAGTGTPVCATCAGKRQQFSTLCDLKYRNCSQPTNSCTYLCDGLCPPNCDDNCSTTGQQGVCATCYGVDVNLSYCNFTAQNCKNPGSCVLKNNGTCAPPCSQPTCPTTPSYICAQCCNGNMTFNTECDMNKFNCQFKTNCTKSYDGKCKPVCPEICPLYVDRVCGSCEGKPSWYSNQCFLNIALCKNPDTCKQVPNSECCNQFCPAIYKPVCGRCNGKTSLYPNQCILDIEICKNPTTCEKVPDSYCCPTSCPANSPTICAKCNGVVQNITQCQYDIKNCNQANTCVKVSDNACPTPCATSCPPNSPLICAKCNGVVQNITQCQYDIKNCNQANTCVKVSDKACPTPCATTCPPNSPTICAKCNGVVQNITQCQYDIKNCNQANTCVKVSDKVCPTPCPTSCPPNSKIICAKCNGIIGNISQCEFDIKNCNQPNSCEKICDDDCSKRCPSPSSCPPNSKKICAKCNGVVQNITQCQFDIKNCNEANSCDKVSDNACPPPCPVACPKNYDPICAICDGKKETVGNDCLYQQRICRDKAKCKKLCKGDCAVVCPDECDESGPEVCARKGSTEKSFCNKCFVAKANCDEQDKDDWVIVSQGTCPKNPCVDCCPDKESSPICAIKDGKCKKFLNQCQFKKANCECKKSGDKQWKKVCDGNCPKNCGKMDDDCSHEKEGKDNSKEDGGSKEWGRHYDGKRSRHH